MSASEVKRIFAAIQSQYKSDGSIDPHQKAMLLEKMKKFVEGEKFVQMIDETMQKIAEVTIAVIVDPWKVFAEWGPHPIYVK